MKIALAQIEPSQIIEDNYKKIESIVNYTAADLIIFPELAISSYSFKVIKNIKASIIHEYLEKIQLLTKNSATKTIIVGTPRIADNKIYNSAAIINHRDIVFYDKVTLTEDDQQLFEAGKDFVIKEINNKRFGVIICRDQNNIDLILKYKNKVDFLIQLSAHYYEMKDILKKTDKNKALPIVRAIDVNAAFIKVNTVGLLDNQISHGNSLIVSKTGQIIRTGNTTTEEVILMNTEEIEKY
jgi:predicted amidohydrolase